MSPLREAIKNYLDLRHSSGFKLNNAGHCLSEFASFLETRNATHITAQLALEWAQLNPSSQPSTWAQRLGYVRSFTRYHIAADPQTEIPPPGLLPFSPRRARPYLYSEEEIAHLLRCALELQPIDGLRPWTFYCLLGLLSVTGLRIGEAIRLHLEDVNLQDGLLTVRGTKFGKSRLVPIHRTTREVLAEYLVRRERCLAGRNTSSLIATGTIWISVTSIEPSTSSRARRDCVMQQPATARACTTFVIGLRFRRCCDGIARARMRNATCRCCLLTWGTSMSPTPTGISALARN